MTNSDLLQRQQALEQAASVFGSARARYAVQKNLREVEAALQTYSTMLTELAREHDVEPTEAGGFDLDAAPGPFREELEELLQIEVEHEPQVHTIGTAVLDVEDANGQEIPFEVLASLDFMIESDPASDG